MQIVVFLGVGCCFFSCSRRVENSNYWLVD
jgi:hypothetical protein